MGIIGIIAMHGSGRGRNGSCSADTEGWRVFETLLLLLLLTGAVQSSRIGEVSLVLDIFPVSHLSGSSSSVASFGCFSSPSEPLRRDLVVGLSACMLDGSLTHVSPDSSHVAQG